MARLSLITITCAACATLLGCAGDTNLIRDAFVAAGMGAERRKAPEFVEKSRPAAVDFAPIGVTRPKRAVAAKTKPAVTAAEAEMDAVRAANEARARETMAMGATVGPLERPSAPTAVR